MNDCHGETVRLRFIVGAWDSHDRSLRNLAFLFQPDWMIVLSFASVALFVVLPWPLGGADFSTTVISAFAGVASLAIVHFPMSALSKAFLVSAILVGFLVSAWAWMGQSCGLSVGIRSRESD